MTQNSQTRGASQVGALTALAAGAVGSVGFTFYAGIRIGSPVVLLVLFAGWVIFPFLILAVAYLVSRRRSVLTERALRRAAPTASVVSVVVYGVAAIVPARPPTPVFVLVAPLSLLLVGLLVPASVILGGRDR